MAGAVSDPTEASARTVWGGCNPEGQLSRQSCRPPDTESFADAEFLIGGNRPEHDIPEIAVYFRVAATVAVHAQKNGNNNVKKKEELAMILTPLLWY